MNGGDAAAAPGPPRRDVLEAMFGRVAGRYDRINAFLSFGMHHRWRRFAIRQCRVRPGAWALDVGTGTADFAIEFAARGARALGVDPCGPMIRIGKAKLLRRGCDGAVRLLLGEAEHLPVKEGRFDCASIGFALRNVADIDATFSELARAVRPGGRVVALEIARPRLPVFRPLFLFYFYHVGPRLARLMGGDREAYRYLPESLRRFRSREEIAGSMERAGLTQVGWYDLSGGSVTVHVGTRPAGEDADGLG